MSAHDITAYASPSDQNKIIYQKDLIDELKEKYPGRTIIKDYVYDDLVAFSVMESDEDTIEIQFYIEENSNDSVILMPAYKNAWLSPIFFKSQIDESQTAFDL